MAVPIIRRAPGQPGYVHNTTVSFGGVSAKYVRLTIEANWGGVSPSAGLSEVRFFYIPDRSAPQQCSCGIYRPLGGHTSGTGQGKRSPGPFSQRVVADGVCRRLPVVGAPSIRHGGDASEAVELETSPCLWQNVYQRRTTVGSRHE